MRIKGPLHSRFATCPDVLCKMPRQAFACSLTDARNLTAVIGIEPISQEPKSGVLTIALDRRVHRWNRTIQGGVADRRGRQTMRTDGQARILVLSSRFAVRHGPPGIRTPISQIKNLVCLPLHQQPKAAPAGLEPATTESESDVLPITPRSYKAGPPGYDPGPAVLETAMLSVYTTSLYLAAHKPPVLTSDNDVIHRHIQQYA